MIARLTTYGARVKLSKCEICPSSFEYLGHIISGGRRYPQPRKLIKFENIKKPTTLNDIRSIIGMFSYYRYYIKNFSERILPITRMLRKGARISWTAEHESIIQQLISDLNSASLTLTSTSNTYRIETDASNVAMGAVLYDLQQYNSSSNPLPLVFISKTFDQTQQNWSTAEKEAYSIVWALETLQSTVKGCEVHVYTDHKNLPTLFKQSKGKIERWAIRLSEFNPSIHYIKGNDNIVADFLSRQIDDSLLPNHMFYCGAHRAKRPSPDSNQQQPPDVIYLTDSEDDDPQPPQKRQQRSESTTKIIQTPTIKSTGCEPTDPPDSTTDVSNLPLLEQLSSCLH